MHRHLKTRQYATRPKTQAEGTSKTTCKRGLETPSPPGGAATADADNASPGDRRGLFRTACHQGAHRGLTLQTVAPDREQHRAKQAYVNQASA